MPTPQTPNNDNSSRLSTNRQDTLLANQRNVSSNSPTTPQMRELSPHLQTAKHETEIPLKPLELNTYKTQKTTNCENGKEKVQKPTSASEDKVKEDEDTANEPII